jgi:RNA ligase (TIGR02306 family)
MSHLATIQIIKSLEPIVGADKIELCKFNDVCWQSVVKKEEFKVGQKVIYVSIDTILPDGAAWAQFLKDKKLVDEPIRLRTCRLRGALSQGLVLPLTVLPQLNGEPYLGFCDETDISEILGIIKYEKPLPPDMSARGNFPAFLRKTDEERLQGFPLLLDEIRDKEIYISLKMDGSSATYYSQNGEVGVCSRKLDLTDTPGNKFWKIGHDLGILDALKAKGNYSVQGEFCGPSVQSNRLGLTTPALYIFNLWSIDEQKYLGLDELIAFCDDFKLQHVPILYRGIFDYKSVEELIEFANAQRYPNGNLAEGIVIRPTIESYSNVMKGRLSFKVISNVFAEKYGE